MRHREELIDFIDRNGGTKVAYMLTMMSKSTLEELNEEYMGLYTHRQMMNDPIYGQILYNWCLSNACELKHGHNPKIFFVQMKTAVGKVIAKHEFKPVEEIPASHVKARCAQLLIIIHILWKVLQRVEEKKERRMVGKRMILGLM